MNYKKIQHQSEYVRNIFREIEPIKWEAKHYGIELIIQTGHLADIILRQSHKLNKYSELENTNIISDEISDILLNLYSISIEKNIDINSYISDYSLSNSVDPLRHTALLSGYISEITLYLFEEDDSTRALDDMLEKCFKLTIDLIEHFDVNIETAFSKMVNESEVFVKKNKI
ncbi:hypothetical protein KC669_05110 [Candidatus Dojkabacteria bacterium]|uniref:Uncharacterized protein n=1 Tax=Candidatus Dojkabacteria bacterium TaxID=2099670 RepID=A0A955LB85_9BACT|nr:hypothetical protein [Candidatus Dojkabacteria bacterium]